MAKANDVLMYFMQGSKESTATDEDEDSSTDEEPETMEGETPHNKSTEGAGGEPKPQTTETEAGAEISALVNYVQPVHFSSFENAKSK